MLLCKYKDAFGKPNEGAHKIRIFNIALVDSGLTILVAIIIALIFKFSFLQFTVLLFIIILLGIFIHRLFCVNSTINKLIFGNV
jgi:hypothetical protein